VTVTTAGADMHSGMKGGSVQNANHALAQLLAGLWDTGGGSGGSGGGGLLAALLGGGRKKAQQGNPVSAGVVCGVLCCGVVWSGVVWCGVVAWCGSVGAPGVAWHSLGTRLLRTAHPLPDTPPAAPAAAPPHTHTHTTRAHTRARRSVAACGWPCPAFTTPCCP
jgi:hypothetical protein